MKNNLSLSNKPFNNNVAILESKIMYFCLRSNFREGTTLIRALLIPKLTTQFYELTKIKIRIKLLKIRIRGFLDHNQRFHISISKFKCNLKQSEIYKI